MLRHYLFSDSTKSNLIDFVLDFHKKISHSVQIVNENELAAKSESKKWYDQHAREVFFRKVIWFCFCYRCLVNLYRRNIVDHILWSSGWVRLITSTVLQMEGR